MQKIYFLLQMKMNYDDGNINGTEQIRKEPLLTMMKYGDDL